MPAKKDPRRARRTGRTRSNGEDMDFLKKKLEEVATKKAGGAALYLGWDQISAIFEQQQKLSRAVEEVAEQQTAIKEHGVRLAELEKTKTRHEVDLMLLRKDTDAAIKRIVAAIIIAALMGLGLSLDLA